MQHLTRGELARKAGVHPETIRFYERAGVLSSPPRSAAGYRLFPQTAVDRLAQVKSMRKLGFSLPEIRDLLGGTTEMATEERERQLARIEDRIRELHELQQFLTLPRI